MTSTVIDALSSSFGIVLLGVLTSSLLHGFTSFQAILYFRTSSDDSWILKWMVLTLMLIESLQLAFTWHFEWYYFTAAISNQSLLFTGIWSVILTTPLTMLVEFICHAFFIAKIWKLSKRNWVVCGSISVLEIARLATKSVLSVRLFTVSYWAEFGIVLKTCITLPLVLGVCTDIAITCCLCYYLRKCRTGYQRTDNLISHLLYYTINNGILTTAGDIVILGLFLGIPDNLAYLAVFEVISKLYATAILTSLNTRPLLRAQHQAGGLELYRNHLLSPLTPASATKTSLNSAGCASNMSPTFDVIRSGGSRNGETEVKLESTRSQCSEFKLDRMFDVEAQMNEDWNSGGRVTSTGTDG